MKYVLPKIPFLTLHFELQVQQDCRLPVTKGCMLRGAFGRATRRTVCVMPLKQECSNCLFIQLFGTFVNGTPSPFMGGIKQAPKPFVLHSFDITTEYRQKSILRFSMTLLGKTCDYYPYVIFAVNKIVMEGLPKAQHPFKNGQAFWSDYIFDQPEPTLLLDGNAEPLSGTKLRFSEKVFKFDIKQ